MRLRPAPRPALQAKLAIAVMLAGSVIYSNGDPNYNAEGYMWLLINTLLWAVNTLWEKRLTTTTDQTSVGVACYINLLSLPTLLGELVVKGKVQAAMSDFSELDSNVKGAIFATCTLGCSISIVYTKLNKFASATAITIAANINKLSSAILASYIFEVL